MYNRPEWFNTIALEIVDYLSEAMADAHTLGRTKSEIELFVSEKHPDYTKLHAGIVLDVLVQKEIIDYYFTNRSEIPREVPRESSALVDVDYVDFYYLRCYELTSR
jgi:hypothetical protein